MRWSRSMLWLADVRIRSEAMRVARPDELKSVAVPVMTARVSEDELSKWFPVAFHDITDPEETPEPSKGALLKLGSGAYFVVYWGELSNQLTLQIPKTTDASDFLAAFFREVPLPTSRVLWRRADARLPGGRTVDKAMIASAQQRTREPRRTATPRKAARATASRRVSARKK